MQNYPGWAVWSALNVHPINVRLAPSFPTKLRLVPQVVFSYFSRKTFFWVLLGMRRSRKFRQWWGSWQNFFLVINIFHWGPYRPEASNWTHCFSSGVHTSIPKETYSHLWFSRRVGVVWTPFPPSGSAPRIRPCKTFGVPPLIFMVSFNYDFIWSKKLALSTHNVGFS